VPAPAAQQNPGPSFQSNVEYVVVEVRASAADGTPKRGLTREMFRVYEDGVEQQIDAFSVVDACDAAGRRCHSARFPSA
jgi:hypothetical protein